MFTVYCFQGKIKNNRASGTWRKLYQCDDKTVARAAAEARAVSGQPVYLEQATLSSVDPTEYDIIFRENMNADFSECDVEY